MMKWIILAVGVFLFFNGMMSRTYSYSDPERHCWQMDYIGLYSCFSNPLGAEIVVWGATLLGAALIAGCFFYGRRNRV